eukprot:scaffold115746_cov25-Prasinocladus_malaysianus.AAC.3
MFKFWRAPSMLMAKSQILKPQSESTDGKVGNHRQTTSEAYCGYHAGIAVIGIGANSNMPQQSDSGRY